MKYLSVITLVIWAHIMTSAVAFSTERTPGQVINDTDIVNARAETERFRWVGTNHGLFFIKKKGNKVYHLTMKNSILPSDTITCIATKSNGEVYIGTTNGIVRYDNYTFLLINIENSLLASNKITSMVSVTGNEIFAGTFEGITIFLDGRSKTYNAANSALVNNHILSLEKFGKDSLVASLEHNVSIGIRNGRFTLLNSCGK